MNQDRHKKSHLYTRKLKKYCLGGAGGGYPTAKLTENAPGFAAKETVYSFTPAVILLPVQRPFSSENTAESWRLVVHKSHRMHRRRMF